MLMMASTISRRGRAASLKGKHGLSRGFGRYWMFQRLRCRQVDPDAEHIGQPVFDRDHIQERQTARGIELSDDVHPKLPGPRFRERTSHAGTNGRLRPLSVAARERATPTLRIAIHLANLRKAIAQILEHGREESQS